MSTTPTLNGQVIGLAHYATRALLERTLARLGVTFQQSAMLNAVAEQDGVHGRDQLVARLTAALKTEAAAVVPDLAALLDGGHLEPVPGDGSLLRLTESGRAVQGGIRAGVGAITARLYGDIPAGDLAVAARVLAAVTARADAELAAVAS